MQMLEGIKEVVIKESVDEFDEEKISSLITKGVQFPKPILTFDDDPFIFPHTINLIQGSYGTNKSYFASHIASAFLNVNREPPLLKMIVDSRYEYLVVYVDTERPLRDQLPAAINQIIKNAGLPENTLPHNFKVSSVKKYRRAERLEMTKKYIDKVRESDKHIILILDVVTDCMKSFNDLGETNSLLDELNNITENEEITIIGVIHENPDGSKKARGHLGTELVNKATTVVSIGYKNEDTDVLSLRIIKNRLVKRQKEKYLKRSQTSGLLVFADSSEIEEMQSKNKIKLSELSDFIFDRFNGYEYSTKELLKIIQDQFDVSEKPAREAINKLYDNQQILREKGFELKMRKGKHNSKIYSLVELIGELQL